MVGKPEDEKSPASELLKLTGGEEMKYQGITIHKNKTCNTWYTRYRDITGKQIYLSAKTQQACYDKLKMAITKNNKLALNPPKKKSITLLEWYNTWLKTFKSKSSKQTIKDYKNSLKHLEKLQNKELTNITSFDIIQELNKITAPRAKQKVYEFIVMLFNKAIKMDLLEKSPILAIEKPKYTRSNNEVFSVEDENLFIEICKMRNLEMYLVALYQGLRHGELLAITNQDIDFTNKTLNIDKSLLENNTFGKTKNNSDRIMPLFENSIEILNNYKNVSGRIFKTSYDKTGRIFKNLKDEFFKNKKYSIKTLRYTFITKCQEANIPEHIIQKWVGHEIGSPVTKKTYTKVRDHAEIENIKIYNDKFYSNSTQQ